MTSLADLPIRDDLRGQVPYGAPQIDVPVRLNVNENTHGIPTEVVDDIVSDLADAVAGANRYPDREFVELRHRLAEYLGHGLDADQLWAANGSNEVLQQVLQAFGGPGRTLLSFTPSHPLPKWSMTRLCTAKHTAHTSTSMSPAASRKLPLMHSR